MKPETLYIAKTLAGLEEILAEELKSLGATDINILNRAVSFKGDLALMYKANYWCRTALRILKPIAEFDVSNEDELYTAIYKLNWEDYLNVNDTIAIDSVISNSEFSIQNSSFKNSLYVSQRVKDAIADRFIDKFSQRPSVDLDNPNLRINIYISDKKCTVSLDSSGTSLHKRGYRQAAGLAPINEVLAAGLILLSGWQRDCNFIDTMCGSGTFLIEAALIAYNLPPGFYRKSFGFEKWKDFNFNLWHNIKNEALTKQKEFEYRIIGSDISQKALDNAKQNINFAKLHKDINLALKSFTDFVPHESKGVLFMNPPYGERLKQENIIALYKSIGDTLKNKYKGYQAYIISSDLNAIKFIGLHPSKKWIVFNGPLECRFLKFDIYEGSKKSKFNSED